MKLKKTLRRPAIARPTAARTSRAPRALAARTSSTLQGASADSQRIALLAAQAGLDKKASGVDIIDVTGKVDYADLLVLMTGQSDRHVTAIAGAVEDHLRQHGHRMMSVEGLPRAQWVLLDFVDVVVHVFLEEARGLYDLDGLWMDAARIPVPEADAQRRAARAGGGEPSDGS